MRTAEQEVGGSEARYYKQVGDDAAHRLVAMSRHHIQQPCAKPPDPLSSLAQHAALHDLGTIEETVGYLAQALGTELSGKLTIGSDSGLVVLSRGIPLEANLVAESGHATPVQSGQVHCAHPAPLDVAELGFVIDRGLGEHRLAVEPDPDEVGPLQVRL